MCILFINSYYQKNPWKYNENYFEFFVVDEGRE